MQKGSAMLHEKPSRKLRREIGLFLLLFYGLGNILGAGIYVLIGDIVKISGYYAPVSFLVACIVVFFTALSYAELSARFPQSAGEALYVWEGFGIRWLSRVVGLTIALGGMLSTATIVTGFYDYFSLFFSLPKELVIFVLLTLLVLIAVWGIKESVTIAAILTFVEIFGLLMVIYVGVEHTSQFPDLTQFVPPADAGVINAILLGAFLAFYAFLGFEDMVNIAEEVKTPAKTMPKAIVLVLVVATLLYVGVAFVTILVIPPDEMHQSNALLAQVYEKATGEKATILSMIGMLAVINGALVQIIMASRIFYGMAANGWLFRFLAKVDPVTHTPIAATIMTGAVIFLFTLWLPLLTLAQYTSFLIFLIFTVVNGALIRIKLQKRGRNDIKMVPLWIPVIAIVLNLIMLTVQIMDIVK